LIGVFSLTFGVDAALAVVCMAPLDELYDRINHSEQVGLKKFSVLATTCLVSRICQPHEYAMVVADRSGYCSCRGSFAYRDGTNVEICQQQPGRDGEV